MWKRKEEEGVFMVWIDGLQVLEMLDSRDSVGCREWKISRSRFYLHASEKSLPSNYFVGSFTELR